MSSKAFKVDKPKTVPAPSSSYSVTDRARTYDIQSYGVPSQYQALNGRATTYVVNSDRKQDADFYDIQQAIDALNGRGGDGGSILLKNGTYNVSDFITIALGNVSIIGENKDKVIVDFGNTDKRFILGQYQMSTPNMSLSNFTIIGGGIGLVNPFCIQSYSGTNVFIDNIVSQYGLSLATTDFITTTPSSTCVVSNSYFGSYSSINNSGYNTRVHAHDNTFYGLGVSGNNNGTYIDHNYIENGPSDYDFRGNYAVFVNGIGSNMYINDNTIYDTGIDTSLLTLSGGILLSSSAAYANVHNNRIVHSGSTTTNYGIYVDQNNGFGHKITNNTMSVFVTDDIYLAAGANYNTVMGNFVRGAGITDLGTGNLLSNVT